MQSHAQQQANLDQQGQALKAHFLIKKHEDFRAFMNGKTKLRRINKTFNTNQKEFKIKSNILDT